MEIPSAVVVWSFVNFKGNLQSENNYQHNQGLSLLCIPKGQQLVNEKQAVGINLDISSDTQTKVHLAVPDNKKRQILTGEPFALGIGGGEAYLRYGHRSVGINLKWSEEPTFEWRMFMADGKEGQPVPAGTPVALINIRVEPAPDFFIPLNRRTPGAGNIGWTTSPDWRKVAANKAAAVAAQAALKALIK